MKYGFHFFEGLPSDNGAHWSRGWPMSTLEMWRSFYSGTQKHEKQKPFSATALSQHQRGALESYYGAQVADWKNGFIYTQRSSDTYVPSRVNELWRSLAQAGLNFSSGRDSN